MTSGAGGSPAGAGELRLDVTDGRAAGFSFVVDDRLVIGRNSEGPGRLADDPELSRHHAEIARAPGGQFTIKDLSSTNGTLVNGTRLQEPATLVVSDRIEVGSTRLTVRAAPVAAPPAPADVDVRVATVVGEVRRPGPVAGLAPAPGPVGPARPATDLELSAPGQPLALRLTLDFDRSTAQLSLEGNGAPIVLVLDHGQWRVTGGGS